MTKLPDKLRKAAILISTLDPQSADALLDQMPAEQAARIRRTMIELEEVGAVEQEGVIREFLIKHQGPTDAETGVELDPSLLRRMKETGQVETYPTTSDASEVAPFRFLHQAATDALGRLLVREHPQISAVVLSHLPPEKAVNVLVLFPADLQAAVLRRVADLDAADPEMLQELEAELRAVLVDQPGLSGPRAAGMSAVNAILRAADSRDRKDILANLDQRDQQLARRLEQLGKKSDETPLPAVNATPRSRMNSTVTPMQPAEDTPHTPPTVAAATVPRATVDEHATATTARRAQPEISLTFDDCIRLSNQDLARLLQHCDPQVTLLALTGAPAEFVNRLLQLLPNREARQLKQRMQKLGPLLLSDVEQAQQQVADVAARLAAQNSIEVPLPRGFAAAA